MCHVTGAVLASPTDNQIGNALKSLIAQSGLNSDFFLGTHALFDKEHAVSVEGKSFIKHFKIYNIY